jgi:hypothetical protein
MQSQVLLIHRILSDFFSFICPIQSTGFITCKEVSKFLFLTRPFVGSYNKATRQRHEAKGSSEAGRRQSAQQYEEPNAIGDPPVPIFKRREWQPTVLDTTIHRLADFTTSKILHSESNERA